MRIVLCRKLNQTCYILVDYAMMLCMLLIAIPEGVLLGPTQTWGSSQSSAPISLSLRPGGSQRLCPARGTSPP